MKIGVLAFEWDEWHVKRLHDSLKSRGIETYVISPKQFLCKISGSPRISVKNHSIESFNAIIVRKIPGGTPEQIFYRMDVLHRLEEMGVYIMNSPYSIERSVDKFYTSGLLEDAGISTPRTLITERFEEAMKAFSELGGDIVIKPIFGSLGFGMTRVNDQDIAYRVFRTLEVINSVYYLQEYIPHKNKDLRALVVGGKVVASMQRTAKQWKTNIASGGEAKPYELDKNLTEISVKAAEAIELEYTGVDLMTSEKDEKTYVIEVNSTPGWEGLQTVTEKNISDIIVDHLLSKL